MENKSKLLNDKVIETLNYRIQQEEHSSRIYEQLSLWLNNKGYLNFAELFKKYADEELVHAGFSKSYLLDYGITPCLQPLPSPEMEIESLLDVLEAAYDHELLVTKQCEDLASLALKEGNHVLYQLALKYCAEQQEEIGKSITNLDIYKLSTDMLIIDHYVGEKLL
jgi:ferritin